MVEVVDEHLAIAMANHWDHCDALVAIKLCRTRSETPLGRTHLQLLACEHGALVARGTMERMAFWHDAVSDDTNNEPAAVLQTLHE